MLIYLLVFTDNYWSNAHNRRKFFFEFALLKGFDPLVAVNWKNIRYRDMIKQVKRKKHVRRSGSKEEQKEIDI